jgi:hypothetical protein
MDGWQICFEFLLVFVVGILSGFGLGFGIFVFCYQKRAKAYFVCINEMMARFDCQMDIISDMLGLDDDSDDETSEGGKE